MALEYKRDQGTTVHGHQHSLMFFLEHNYSRLLDIRANRKHVVEQLAKEGSSPKYVQENLAQQRHIHGHGYNTKLREQEVRRVLSMIPTPFNLDWILSHIHVYEHPMYIVNGGKPLVHSNEALKNLTMQTSEAKDPWMFVTGDVSELAPNHMKFNMHIYNYPRGVHKDARKIHMEYTILKQIGLVLGMAAYFSDRYNLKEKTRHYKIVLRNGREVTGAELMREFDEALKQHDEIAPLYMARHIGKNLPDDRILDAFSDTFAAYFMGFYMVEDDDYLLIPNDLSSFMFQYINCMLITNPY